MYRLQRRMTCGVLATAFVAMLAGGRPAVAAADAPRVVFEVSIDPAVRSEPFTGRLYVALAPAEMNREPVSGLHSWFNPPPAFAVDVQDLAPGAVAEIGADALGHPMTLAELPAGSWQAQAVARVNLDSPKAGFGAGDLTSGVELIEVADAAAEAGGAPTRVRLVLGNVVSERPFRESERVKLFEMTSPSLSAFLGRDRTVQAGVVLPEGYAERRAKGETFPVVVWIGGFGGTHRDALGMGRRGMTDDPDGPAAIWVVPDASCFRGHSVFADSANNGPWGAMLVDEMLPAIDAAYGGAGPEHRYVTGISSGGWACLWLQVAYPEAFAGCWSHVPDPVDFRDFQMIDLYAPGTNMFVDADGGERPLARRNGAVMLEYRAFVDRETVLGPGGQIHSFEAVFSPRGADGTPRLIFDRQTGEIDTAVTEAWRPYDIGLILRENWDTLGPRLAGKVRVYAGGEDTFYLEGAVELMQKDLAAVVASEEAVIEVIPGMPHSVHQPAMADMRRTLAERWAARADAGADAGAGARP